MGAVVPVHGAVVPVHGGCGPCTWGLLSLYMGAVVPVHGGCGPCTWGLLSLYMGLWSLYMGGCGPCIIARRLATHQSLKVTLNDIGLGFVLTWPSLHVAFLAPLLVILFSFCVPWCSAEMCISFCLYIDLALRHLLLRLE